MNGFEEKARRKGFKIIAGVDEAGRGPLAGPVVAAACILPQKLPIAGINDSKQLTAAERMRLYEELTSHPEVVLGVGLVDAILIDQINILQATFLAMVQAVATLKRSPDYVLVDGPLLPPLPMPAEAVVEGDQRSISIAAASIIAKVHRDAVMEDYHKKWPLYLFHKHKGYPTAEHLALLQKFGPCPIHRRSFAPVRRFC